MQVTIEINKDVASKLHNQAQKNGVDLGQYISMLLQEKESTAKLKKINKQVLSQEETQLFHKINYGFSEAFWARFQTLKEKREQKQLTEADRLELIAITDEMEEANVERIKALIELAQIRKTDLEHLMTELGILYGQNLQEG